MGHYKWAKEPKKGDEPEAYFSQKQDPDNWNSDYNVITFPFNIELYIKDFCKDLTEEQLEDKYGISDSEGCVRQYKIPAAEGYKAATITFTRIKKVNFG